MYELIDDITASLKASGFNNVTFGDIDEIDLDKTTIYPLAHFMLSTSALPASTNKVGFEFIFVDIVKETKSITIAETNNPLKIVSNEVDIANDLNVKASHFFTSMTKPSDSYYRKLTTEELAMNFFFERLQNRLAGYETRLDFNIQKPVC